MDIDASIAGVLAKHDAVAVAYLFGSVAAGRARPDSDLDVGIVYRRDTVGRDLLAAEIGVAIGKSTGFERVDVVDLDAQGPIFCHEVLLTGRRVYEADPERRVDFESDTMIRAFDFRPTYDRATRGKVAAFRRWLRERNDSRSASDAARPPALEPRKAR